MQRAATYARFSTDLQSERSVDDQLSLCREFAQRTGVGIVGEYFDKARSGTTMAGRSGLADLMAAAARGEFSVLIVEALDRLSRDIEDLAGIHKRLTFAGIEIIAVHDGKADALQIGIRGLVSSLFITDLKHKIRRGMAGMVDEGRLPGRCAYGYRPILGRAGEREIYDPEADIVRRIFREHLDGLTARDIAHGLNADGIPSPAGRLWSSRALNGCPTRGYGILHNTIYAGKIIWNRQTKARNPDTGKMVTRTNPRDEWRETMVPHLAIIDPDDFYAAQRPIRRVSQFKRNRRILSGLLRCAACGGGMSIHDRRGDAVRITCTTFAESRSCSCSRHFNLNSIEGAVIGGLKDRLSDPIALRAYIEGYMEEMAGAAQARGRAERALAKIEGQIDRLNDALIEGRIDADYFDRKIADLRIERDRAGQSLAAAPADAPLLHPGAIARARQAVSLVMDRLSGPDPDIDQEVFDGVREIIDRVVVADTGGGSVAIDVFGRIGPAPVALGGVSKNA